MKDENMLTLYKPRIPSSLKTLMTPTLGAFRISPAVCKRILTLNFIIDKNILKFLSFKIYKFIHLQRVCEDN